jgi:hypothetical protein
MSNVDLYFSEHFAVDAAVLENYSAFDDISLFIDPLLLFNSHKPEYQALHHPGEYHDRLEPVLVGSRGHAHQGSPPAGKVRLPTRR